MEILTSGLRAPGDFREPIFGSVRLADSRGLLISPRVVGTAADQNGERRYCAD